MIDVKATIHDKFSIEFKFAYIVRKKIVKNHFSVNTWIFIPESLDLNAITYPKKRFYSDVKIKTRLITPSFLLRDIANNDSLPFRIITAAFHNVARESTHTHIKEFEYQAKMFASIFHVAVRDEYLHLESNNLADDMKYLCMEFARNIQLILQQFRELRLIINVPTVPSPIMNLYLLGDEFMSNIAQNYIYKLVDYLEKEAKLRDPSIVDTLKNVARDEEAYKNKMGYPLLDFSNKDKNRGLVRRLDILNKYVTSDLHVESKTKRDGLVIEQIYYSIAAGISMIFATTIAFSFQKTFGNFTMPLFVALVVSYMLKDRIKELMRFYFAYKLGHKYFDSKTTIKIKDSLIGWKKDAVDYITLNKVPARVTEIRNYYQSVNVENYLYSENILLIRKLIEIDRNQLESNSDYFLKGINEIVRLDIKRYVYNMDNPEVELQGLDVNGNIITLYGEKTYVVYIVMQLNYEATNSYMPFRITLSRDEIVKVEQLELY